MEDTTNPQCMEMEYTFVLKKPILKLSLEKKTSDQFLFNRSKRTSRDFKRRELPNRLLMVKEINNLRNRRGHMELKW